MMYFKWSLAIIKFTLGKGKSMKLFAFVKGSEIQTTRSLDSHVRTFANV